jgi:hypothetical protein
MKTYDGAKLWLYSEISQPTVTPPEGGESGGSTPTPTPTPTVNAYKKALYDILHEGIEYDYSAYKK